MVMHARPVNSKEARSSSKISPVTIDLQELPRRKQFEVVGANRSEDSEHSDDGASSSRSNETQVIHTQEGVSVWPAKKQCITGRVSLIKQDTTVFFTWLPHPQGASSADKSGATDAQQDLADLPTTPVSQGQYAVHPIPLTDIKSLRKHTPKMMNHFIVLVLKNGLTLPAFYFDLGGVRGLFSAIKQHAIVTKSAHDQSTFLINDTEDPLQRSLATMDLSDALMMEPAQLAKLPQSTHGIVNAEGHDFFGRMMDGYQRATQFARETTNSILATPHVPPPASDGDSESMKREEREQTNVGCFELVDRSESETMSHSIDHPCPPPLSQDEWFTYLDSAGRIMDTKTLRTRIFYAGVEPSVRKEAWKFLLGWYSPGSTSAYRNHLHKKRVEEYAHLKAQWSSITDKQAARFGKWRERKTRVDKDVNRTDCSHPFFKGPNNPNVEILRSILLTYSMYNFDLGYCQGMSDLASPILYVMKDEATAFWCFASLMEKMETNFSTDCVGMHTQLGALKNLIQTTDPELHNFLENRECLNYFFCYRWLLVHFKREFEFEEGLQLWEALWSCPYTPHFHIFMCAAVLRLHRKTIMSANMSFDELLSFCILLSGKIDLGRTMRVAEKIYKSCGEAGRSCLKPLDPTP